jgi:hypothetical protein
MNLPNLIDGLTKHPGMYLSRTSEYDDYASFLLGVDVGSEGVALFGFREWLVPQVGISNFTWSRLVLHLAFPDAEDAMREAHERPAQAIATLLILIRRYLDARAEHDGLARIFATYAKWLSKQEWFSDDN